MSQQVSGVRKMIENWKESGFVDEINVLTFIQRDTETNKF